jgi:hypothetical protein
LSRLLSLSPRPLWVTQLLDAHRTQDFIRGKLKLGGLWFVEKKFFFGSYCIWSGFEMQYKSQVGSDKQTEAFVKIVKILDFAWNFQTIVTVSLTLLLIYLLLKVNFWWFYDEFISNDFHQVAKFQSFSYIADSTIFNKMHSESQGLLRALNEVLFINYL